MEKLKISGLWKNENRNGNAYYAGSLSPSVRVMIFKNMFKNSERDPEAILYLAPNDRQKDGDRSAPQPAELAKSVAPESLSF